MRIETIQILCDWCGKDISGEDIDDYRFILKAEHMSRNYPDLYGDLYFCSLECLKNFVDKNIK